MYLYVSICMCLFRYRWCVCVCVCVCVYTGAPPVLFDTLLPLDTDARLAAVCAALPIIETAIAASADTSAGVSHTHTRTHTHTHTHMCVRWYSWVHKRGPPLSVRDACVCVCVFQSALQSIQTGDSPVSGSQVSTEQNKKTQAGTQAGRHN